MRKPRPHPFRPAAVSRFILLAGLFAIGCRKAEARPVAGGDAERGKIAIGEYGCGSCHTIPGIRSANGLVGPPLTDWSERGMIAGYVPNTTDFLIRWIEVPRAIKPMTAMPNLAVPESDARDIAAYLYTLH